MATIVATVDTDSDTLSVSVNGTDIPNVVNVSMCVVPDYDMDGDSCQVCIGTSNNDEEMGLVTRTYITRGGVSKDPVVTTDLKTSKAMKDIRDRLL